jgi:hypothetical protein
MPRVKQASSQMSEKARSRSKSAVKPSLPSKYCLHGPTFVAGGIVLPLISCGNCVAIR